MRTSQLLLATLKENPADAELTSHRLMLRAGMIRRLSSGIYNWLPLGFRVLHKVTAVVREEMNKAGAQEFLMPSIHPAELWQETGRWEQYGTELLKITDRHQREFCYGPTHEEVITDLARHELKSYKQLPTMLYQIQTKFRDEIRPRFGVMRAREFLMKDAYSFHTTQDCLQKTYDHMYDVYTRIFSRLGLDFRAVLAGTGAIGGSHSHEFQVLADSGEDIIAYSDSSPYAANIEWIASEHLHINPDDFTKEALSEKIVGTPSPDGKGTLKVARGIEVGQIFQLGTKYSQSMGATVLDQHGTNIPMVMGCYGIGISRTVAAAIEQHHDERGIIWPTPMAPFDIAIVPIAMQRSDRIRLACESLYQQLQQQGYDVLLDDRDERPGALFADMDLIGIPHRLVISERGLDNGTVEYKSRQEAQAQHIPNNDVLNFINHMPR